MCITCAGFVLFQYLVSGFSVIMSNEMPPKAFLNLKLHPTIFKSLILLKTASRAAQKSFSPYQHPVCPPRGLCRWIWEMKPLQHVVGQALGSLLDQSCLQHRTTSTISLTGSIPKPSPIAEALKCLTLSDTSRPVE